MSGGIYFFTQVYGLERVYDFGSMQSDLFYYLPKSWFNRPSPYTSSRYEGIWSTIIVGGSGTWYMGNISGFRSWRSLEDDYEGMFDYEYYGGAIPLPYFTGVSGGYMNFWARPRDTKIAGSSSYIGFGLGVSVPGFDHGQGTLYYSKVRFSDYSRNYGEQGKGGRYVNPATIMSDIYKSTEVFAERPLGKLPSLVGLLYTVREKESRGFANIDKYARAFNGIQIDSYE